MAKTIITGGAGGIGAALAAQCSVLGEDVAVLDKVLPETPLQHVSYKAIDLCDEASVQNAFHSLHDEVSLLVVCAGVMRRGKIFTANEDDYSFIMDNNVKTAWLTLKTARHFLAPDATVVVVSSFHAMYPEPHPGLYTIAKKATTALAEVFELSHPEFRVKIAYPGPVCTGLLKQGRSEAECKAIEARAVTPDILAQYIVELIRSPHRTLQFAPEAWDYVLQ